MSLGEVVNCGGYWVRTGKVEMRRSATALTICLFFSWHINAFSCSFEDYLFVCSYEHVYSYFKKYARMGRNSCRT